LYVEQDVGQSLRERPPLDCVIT